MPDTDNTVVVGVEITYYAEIRVDAAIAADRHEISDEVYDRLNSGTFKPLDDYCETIDVIARMSDEEQVEAAARAASRAVFPPHPDAAPTPF